MTIHHQLRPWPPEPAGARRRRIARNVLTMLGVVVVAYGLFFAAVGLFLVVVKALS